MNVYVVLREGIIDLVIELVEVLVVSGKRGEVVRAAGGKVGEVEGLLLFGEVEGVVEGRRGGDDGLRSLVCEVLEVITHSEGLRRGNLYLVRGL